MPRPAADSSSGSADVSERLLTPMQVSLVAAAMPPRYQVLVLAAAWSGCARGNCLR